jgi:hypothetical protein
MGQAPGVGALHPPRKRAGDDIFSKFQALLAGVPEASKPELDAQLGDVLKRRWTPQPGPQTDAYLSLADELLYGGAAGGGKSDLGVGYAIEEAERAVIFRRQSTDLAGLTDRLVEIAGPEGYAGSPTPRYRQPGGRLCEFGHLEKPGSEFGWQGRPHDFIYIDEAAQLSAFKVNFVIGWNRSATGRRCRVILGSNPPLGGQGDWLIEWFAPWLDQLFPNPAQPGELRWCIMVSSGDELRTRWIDEADLSIDEHGRRFLVLPGEDQPRYAKSRTSIPSLLDDNVFLRDTDYRASVDALPEPMRSALLYGSFTAARRDHAWQIIPTAWVVAAQERWRKNSDKKLPPMLALGVDVAQGGGDKTTLAPLHGVRFEELKVLAGKETPDGPTVAAEIIRVRRNDAYVGIDMGGGYGGSARDHLRTHNDIDAFAFVPGKKSSARTKDRKLKFGNLRAASLWALREALDPESEIEMELPPDQRTLAEVTAPRWRLKGDVIYAEMKEDLRKPERLGSSTDRLDAIAIAWHIRAFAELRKRERQKTRDGGSGGGSTPMADPLAGW